MNILYICHRFPFPPKRGGKIRPFNMVRHLSATHRVTVASLARSDEEAREGAGLARHCAAYEMGRVSHPVQVIRMVSRALGPQPSSMGFFYSRTLARRIRSLLARERFDLIVVHCSSVAQYVEHVTGIPKMLDFGDMDSQKWLEYARHRPLPVSVGFWLEGVKLQRAERRLARTFDVCTATTRAEWETLNTYGVEAATDWFPNGVDAEYFAPGDTPYDPDTVCFVGRMDYYPNQQGMFDYCANVLPALRARRPNLRLEIVGANPSAAVRKLAGLPGVSVTGSVPDVRPHLRRAALTIAPLTIARGTQNKILEAMAAGVPVVTSRVAAGGVDARAGQDFLVAATPAEQVEAALRVLENPAERRRLSEAGRARMLSNHSWPHSMRRLDRIIERCLSTAVAPSTS